MKAKGKEAPAASGVPKQQYMMAGMSGVPTRPTRRSGEAPPHHPSSGSELESPYYPAQHQQRATASSAGHLTGIPAPTSSNAYSAGRSFYPLLALDNWQPQDSAPFNWTASAQPKSPQPIITVTPAIAVSAHHFPAQPASDVYTSAASSPQSAYYHNNYARPLLETQTSHFMNPEPPETMQTPPVSAHPSPNDTAMGDQQIRKRSHSEMSADHDFRQQMIAAATANSAGRANGNRAPSRSESVVSGGGEADDYLAKGTRSFKRGDAPKNAHGKYVCDYTEDCREFTFDRKCEWSKHMDKHDRPYRCPHRSCGKLQGFTYSGGLLRHEREVHGKHGGPKAQLMCPHKECKRHAGKGFTRKENLNEHLRRVHFGKDPDSQDVEAGADDGSIADSATQEALAAFASADSSKRKRSLNDVDTSDEVSRMRHENDLLRAEMERKDALIHDLTQQLAQAQRQHREPESISEYQQQ